MVGAELQRLRRRFGWTQQQLAEALGVAANTVARWERDELGMRATAERLIRLIAAQQVPPKRKTKRGK